MPSHLKLAQRTFLLHTALFLFFTDKSTETDYDGLIELFINEQYKKNYNNS